MLTCSCDACWATHKSARVIFKQKLMRMHTPPDILNHLICNVAWIAADLHADHQHCYSHRMNGMALKNINSNKFEVPSKLTRLRSDGINSSVDASQR
jgi:hypothetical protein